MCARAAPDIVTLCARRACRCERTSCKAVSVCQGFIAVGVVIVVLSSFVVHARYTNMQSVKIWCREPYCEKGQRNISNFVTRSGVEVVERSC